WEVGMIAVMRDFDPSVFRCLNHGGAVRYFYLSPIYRQLWHVSLSVFCSLRLLGAPPRLRGEISSPHAHCLEFVAEFRDETSNRHHVGIGERADRLALHHICNLIEQVDVRSLSLACDQVSHYLCRPASSFAAGSALAAGLVSVKVGYHRQHFGHL